MTAEGLIAELKQHGVEFAVESGRLVVDAPRGVLTADIVERLHQHKPEILKLLAPAWRTADWRTFFNEWAGIAEHDGGLDRAEAECRAFEAAVVHWMNCNPPTDPGPDHCAGCGGPLGHIGRDSVPVIRGDGEHVWVHHRCHHRFMARRYAEAVEALAAMGLTPPTGWRARRQTEQKAHIARVRVVSKHTAMRGGL